MAAIEFWDTTGRASGLFATHFSRFATRFAAYDLPMGLFQHKTQDSFANGRIVVTLGDDGLQRLRFLAGDRLRTAYVRELIGELLWLDPEEHHPTLQRLVAPIDTTRRSRLDLRLDPELHGAFEFWCAPNMSTAEAIRAELRLRADGEPPANDPPRPRRVAEASPSNGRAATPTSPSGSKPRTHAKRLHAVRARVASARARSIYADLPPQVSTEGRVAETEESQRLVDLLDEADGFLWAPCWSSALEVEFSELLADTPPGDVRLVVGVQLEDDDWSLSDLDDPGDVVRACDDLLKALGRDLDARLSTHRLVDRGAVQTVIEVVVSLG